MRRRIYLVLMCSLFVLALQPSVRAQDILIPAGTLLHCTLDEPNLSSATAAVGDPVVCPLKSFQEFGHVVFPRGSYLGGHVEAEKDPGHFVGKGFLKLQFDRIGLPTSDIPVPSKVTAVRGFKVDKEGDIKGHGHAVRDVVEWLIPPLWPWKVIMLPARGPRPTLKGEEQITLRLMDDVVVPRNAAATDYYPNRPPAIYHNQPYNQAQPSSDRLGNAVRPIERTNAMSTASYITPRQSLEIPSSQSAAGLTRIALKSGEVQAVRNYHVDSGVLRYELSTGERGSVDAAQVDWESTLRLNSGSNAGHSAPGLLANGDAAHWPAPTPVTVAGVATLN